MHDEQDYGEAKPPLVQASRGTPSPCPSPQPDDLATILYTSGTTGRPRGRDAQPAEPGVQRGGDWPTRWMPTRGQTRLYILPLSHIYARTCDLYTWVYRGSRLVLAESRETLVRDCQLVRPTRAQRRAVLYQRIADRVRGQRRADEAQALGDCFRRPDASCSRRRRCAAAPDVEAWYAERGLPVLPGYGLTESSPVISMSTPAADTLGTVGRPLADVEVRIADDGEILVRGPNVMLGYWQDEAATAEAIRDGWLHTGDLGELDADGFLSIRGRKKELIVLSTGKKVSPTRVESLLTASPLIEQAAVFGEGRAGLVALIVPAKGNEGRAASREELAAEIRRCLASAAHEEQIHHFVVLDRPFSIERGELTPKLSLCREVIATTFRAELEQLWEFAR